MLNSKDTVAIREIVVRGQNDELLNYLAVLVKNNEKASDIAFAVLEAFSNLQPEEWNVDHLTKLKAFSKFSDDELKVKVDSLFYIYDAILFNCLTICNNFYSATLTSQSGRELLEFVRSVKVIFNDEIKIDSVTSYGLNMIDEGFEEILCAISELSRNGRPNASATGKYSIAFSPIHSVIFGCHHRQERMSQKTYDALVGLLNILHASFLPTRSYRNDSELFEGFCGDFGFYVYGNTSRHTELSRSLNRILIASSVLDTMGLGSPLGQGKWLNTRQIYNSIKFLFEAKSRKGNTDLIYQNLESYLNKFQFKDRKGTIELCYLFYQHKQFTYHIFCQVFCNELELREGASLLWDQLNLKIFKDTPEKIKFFSKEEIYSSALLESQQLAPLGESGSRAQELVKLMLSGPFEWGMENRASASEILLVLWHDAQLKLNYPSTEMIFSPNRNTGKIFQYYSYLLLMRLLHAENNLSSVNPLLIDSFFSDDWKKWGSTLYNLIKYESMPVIREFFSIQNETDFHAQLQKLKSPVLLSNGVTCDAYIDGSREDCWDSMALGWCRQDINLLRPLNIRDLKKIISIRKELESFNEQIGVLSEKWICFVIMLPLTIRLVQKYNFSCSVIGHFIAAHVETRRDTEWYRKADFIDKAEAEFQKRFVNITDAKNAVMYLAAWSAKQDSPQKQVPDEIMWKIACYFLTNDFSSAPPAWFFNLISREFFVGELKSSKLGDGHCYAAIRDSYPITEDPSDYKNSIEGLIKKNVFTKEKVEKLPAKSEKSSLEACKGVHK